MSRSAYATGDAPPRTPVPPPVLDVGYSAVARPGPAGTGGDSCHGTVAGRRAPIVRRIPAGATGGARFADRDGRAAGARARLVFGRDGAGYGRHDDSPMCGFRPPSRIPF